MNKEENRFTWNPCVHVFKIILHQRGREGEREREREGAREAGRERGRESGREREGERGRERGRPGERAGVIQEGQERRFFSNRKKDIEDVA